MFIFIKQLPDELCVDSTTSLPLSLNHTYRAEPPPQPDEPPDMSKVNKYRPACTTDILLVVVSKPMPSAVTSVSSDTNVAVLAPESVWFAVLWKLPTVGLDIY